MSLQRATTSSLRNLSARLAKPSPVVGSASRCFTSTTSSSKAALASAPGNGIRGHARIGLKTSISSPVMMQSRSYVAKDETIEDVGHPTGLYFHPIGQSGDKTTYGISFFVEKPSSASSEAIMGSLEVPSSALDNVPVYAREHPDDVKPNKAFWSKLHETFKRELAQNKKDAQLEQEANLRKDGWAHISDQRHPLMPGRIPTPDSIIASVSFTNGELAPESYEVNETYRLVSKEEGFVVLKDVWIDLLKESISK